ncbi:LANO_0F00980g1_1 [Lachancea nothofagi CBS 11611]|uniref:LANO_0F00980g1_1 n=1 Tax=Lachancea nothofagi CBS 11611 TaxID=1266666 RepID=A0A1G4K5R7_9SACH|nr:LANO_0F00980g1_1 [Lachancea nothofagi CBS 11611]
MSSFYHQQFVNSPMYAYDMTSARGPSADDAMYRSLSPNSQLAYQNEQQSVWPNSSYHNNNNMNFVEHRHMGYSHESGVLEQPTFGLIPTEVDNSSSHISTDSSSYSSAPRNSKYAANAAAAAAAAAAANAPMSHKPSQPNNPRDFTSAPSRTVYLGNVSPNIETRQLLDHVRSGIVEDIRILRDKMCAFISFLDESSALLFHSDAILKRFNIEGRDIKIGWGKPTPIDPVVTAGVTNDGATRNVYIGRLNTDPKTASQFGADPRDVVITEDKLREDLGFYGEIESVKIIPEKGIAFVHFTSIYSAIKVVSSLASINPYYTNKKIFYGKDRCAFITKTQQHNAAQFLGLQPGMEHLVQYTDRDFISSTLLQQSAAAAAIATAAGGANNLGNRTIYLGNLPKDVKIEEICNAVRGGLLQNIKLLSDRHVCFVTFIDPTAAAQLYAMTSLHGLTIHNKRCKIGWGKHSGALSNALALAVSHGASRNIYVGNIDFSIDSTRETPAFTEETLRNSFQEFGEVEQINFLPERNCCFVNFTNISSAILAIDKIKAHPHFQNLKINFGKDRCGNVPRQYR